MTWSIIIPTEKFFDLAEESLCFCEVRSLLEEETNFNSCLLIGCPLKLSLLFIYLVFWVKLRLTLKWENRKGNLAFKKFYPTLVFIFIKIPLP